MKCYLINLDRSADRLIEMQKAFQRVGRSFVRIAAVDGARLSEDEVDAFARERPIPPPGRWTPSQVGAFLSHRSAWQLISEDGDDTAAIFEDDVHLAADIKTLLETDAWIPPKADIVRLEGMGNMRLARGRRIRCCKSRRIHRALSDTWGAAGYVLRRRTAKMLLELPPALHLCVDDLMFMPSASPAARRLRTYQVSPSPCVQDQVKEGERIGLESISYPGKTMVMPKPKKRQNVPFFRLSAKVAIPFKP